MALSEVTEACGAARRRKGHQWIAPAGLPSANAALWTRTNAATTMTGVLGGGQSEQRGAIT